MVTVKACLRTRYTFAAHLTGKVCSVGSSHFHHRSPRYRYTEQKR